MAKASCVRCNKLITFRFDRESDGEGDNVRVLLDGCGCCATGRLVDGQHYCLKCAHMMSRDDIQREFDKAREKALIESIEQEHVERLARIDSREVYANPDMFCDSEEWLDERMGRWLQQIEVAENQSGSRRKEE